MTIEELAAATEQEISPTPADQIPDNGAEPINQNDPEQDKMFDFSEARSHLNRLVTDWTDEETETIRRRDVRDVQVDVKALRTSGQLEEDETLIPVRTVDTNIAREQPSYINYLKNSRRIATFRSLDIPSQDPQNIETEFTRGVTYADWETAHYKCVDGAQTHGWATVEVVYDQSKPLNVGLEYVEHESIIWPQSNKNIQEAPRVIRVYDVTFSKLRKWVRDFDFDSEQVDRLISSKKDTKKEIETMRIYKLFFKKEGIVYVAWFALTDGLSDWLKKPSQLFVGIRHKETVTQMVPTTVTDPMTGLPMQQMTPQPSEQWKDSTIEQYPLFVLVYRVTERPKLFDSKGRVFLDENKQEAQTAILSGFINGLTKASNIFASPKQDDGSGSAVKSLENTRLTPGRIFNKPIEFWAPPYPDPILVKAMQYLDVANSQETNQVNFAAMNREDSRKTATEIGAAQQAQQLLNGVQLTLFSTHIRMVYSFMWLIVQSQAMQNKIKFLLVERQVPQINPLTQQPIVDPQTGQPVTDTVWENDFKVIGQSWELRAAGDVDVIQRQEKINQMKQDWPVISNTVLAPRFLADLLKLEYPDVGEQYAQILGQQDQLNMMQGQVARMGMIMAGMLQEHPEMMESLPPEQQQELTQMIQQSQPQQQQPTK